MDRYTFNKRIFTLASILIAPLLVIFFYKMLTVSDPAFSSQPFSVSRLSIAGFSTSCWVTVIGLSLKGSYDESVNKGGDALFRKQLIAVIVAGVCGLGSLFLL